MSNLADAFIAAVSCRDADALRATLAAEVRFFSPVVFKPYEGAELVGTILAEGAMKVFEDDFTYLHRFEDSTRRTAALVFRATAAGKLLDGLDLLTFDGDGQIVELRVMVRPISALQALAGAMQERFQVLGLLPG